MTYNATDDTLSDLMRRSTLSEHTVCGPGEDALKIVVQLHAPRRRVHHAITRMRTYVPGAVKTEAAFVAIQNAIRGEEQELCGMAQRSSMLELVSRDIRRTHRECMLPRKTMVGHTQQITQRVEFLLRDMLRCECGGSDLMDVRGCVPDNFHPYFTEDFPLFKLLSLMNALHFYRDLYSGRVCVIPGCPPKHFYMIRDILCILDVIPTLAFPVDDIQKRLLKFHCDGISQSMHEYYDSGVGIDSLEHLLDSKHYIGALGLEHAI